MIRFFKQLYITDRLFLALGISSLLFVAAFFFTFLFPFAQAFLVFLCAVVLVDLILLFIPAVKISAVRKVQKNLSLGDDNPVELDLENQSPFRLRIYLVEELPEQFQNREFGFLFYLKAREPKKIVYQLRPVTRGIHRFGNVNLFLRSLIGLIQRRIVKSLSEEVAVYPSVIQMKKYELIAMSRLSTQEGIKRLRRIGHSYEFEEIKEYVRGDDYRSINWKASGRTNELMVNQYEDERAQQVYAIIDRSRAMRMPFNGLSLLDYAVNTSLVICNIALLKSDKAGLLTFADKIQTFLKAERHRLQLRKILEALYAQKEESLEANFELLYHAARYSIKGRSLLFLYTNFESQYALERVLPILRRINRLHLLIPIFFQNSEIEDFSRQQSGSLQEIYDQTIAQKFIAEKTQLVSEMGRYGIQSILTRPEDLSINTVNKYLEMKSRGMI